MSQPANFPLHPPLWIELNERGLLRCHGPAARSFLQGQLTQDISPAILGEQRWAWAGHCSPQGRLLATYLLWEQDQSYWLETSTDQEDRAGQLLRRYILRTQVKCENLRLQMVRYGVLGGVAAIFAKAGWPAPPAPGQWDRVGATTRICLSPHRLMLLAQSPAASSALSESDPSIPREWHALATHCQPGSPAHWAWGAIQEGVLEVEAVTSGQWVPQMVNWDRIQGISFTKGCYTGQEIIARTHYLGTVKRQLARFYIPRTPPPLLTPLHLGNSRASEVGKLAFAGKHPDQGWELLAVMHSDAKVGQQATLAGQELAALDWNPAR